VQSGLGLESIENRLRTEVPMGFRLGTEVPNGLESNGTIGKREKR